MKKYRKKVKNLLKKIPGIKDLISRIEKDEMEIDYLKYILNLTCQAPEHLKASELYLSILEIKKLLLVKDVANTQITPQFVRIGKKNDGGYVLFNDFRESSIAYSFGISDDISWDYCMAQRGYEVYMYDHTIKSLPNISNSELSKQLHFFRLGLSDEIRGRLRPLNYYINRNGHTDKKNMVLKMDIEGAEWDVFSKIDIDILKKFKQIVIELHDLDDLNNSKKITEALKKISSTHQLVHIHANNYGRIYKLDEIIFPSTVEVTYLNKEEYYFKENSRVFPTKLDESCNPDICDMYLGKWNPNN